MKVIAIDYRDIPKDLPDSAAAIGYFDGFHTGHLQLISQALHLAAKDHLASAIITFDPDPWDVFKPMENKDHLLSLSDKASMASGLKADYLYILHFSKEFAGQSVESFHQILSDMHVKKLVCGFDFTYGYKGEGNRDSLEKQDLFDVTVIESVNNMKQKISSSRIERLLRAGLLSKANELLGYYYSIPGVVVHGYGRGGRTLGYPTANVLPEHYYVYPARGVYAGYVLIEKSFHPAMINVGSNPTFGNNEITIEAHILDFDRDLYDSIVRVFFVERLRPEIRFGGPQDLKAQLDRDKRRILPLLEKNQNLLGPTVDLWSLPDSFDILN